MSFILNLMGCKNFNAITVGSCSCCYSRGSYVDRYTLIRLPEDLDHNKIIHNPKNAFCIVFGSDKKIISIDYSDTYSILLGIKLDKIKGCYLDDLEKMEGVNFALLNILKDIIESCLKNKEVNGIIVVKGHNQYIISGYPIQDSNGLYGIFIKKSEYYENFYASNLFG